MEQLYYILQQKAPFLLPYIVGVDYLQDDSTVTPLMIVFLRVGQDKILIVPIAGESLYAIYDPDEDRYYPLSAEWFEYLVQKAASPFQAVAQPQNTEDSPNLYNMIRPPLSGRTVYASVVDEPISKEYFEYGFVVVPKGEPTCRALEVDIQGIETIQPGKTYLLRDFEGNLVPARLFLTDFIQKITPLLDEARGKFSGPKDTGLSSGRAALFTPKGVFVGLNIPADLPVGVVAPDQNIPFLPEETGTKVFVCDDTYCYLAGEDLTKAKDITIVVSDHVSRPLVADNRIILPRKGQDDYKVYLIPESKVFWEWDASPKQVFVTTADAFSNIGVTKIIRLVDGTFKLTGEAKPLEKVAVAQKLVEKGIAAEDVYRLVKKAEDQGEVAFVISEAGNQFKNSLNDNTPPQARLNELLEAFDSQMRHFLSLYTKGYLGQETQRVIEDLYDALITYSGSAGGG